MAVEAKVLSKDKLVGPFLLQDGLGRLLRDARQNRPEQQTINSHNAVFYTLAKDPSCIINHRLGGGVCHSACCKSTHHSAVVDYPAPIKKRAGRLDKIAPHLETITRLMDWVYNESPFAEVFLVKSYSDVCNSFQILNTNCDPAVFKAAIFVGRYISERVGDIELATQLLNRDVPEGMVFLQLLNTTFQQKWRKPGSSDQDLGKPSTSYPVLFTKHFVFGELAGFFWDYKTARQREVACFQPGRSLIRLVNDCIPYGLVGGGDCPVGILLEKYYRKNFKASHVEIMGWDGRPQRVPSDVVNHTSRSVDKLADDLLKIYHKWAAEVLGS